MGYNWKEKSKEAENMGDAEKLPEGVHRVRVERVITAKKNGEEMVNAKGDRYIMVILADNQAREAASSFSLETDKGGAFFSRFLEAAKVDFAALDKAGATPETFFDPAWAAKLVGKTLDVECKHNQSGEKTYVNVYPILPQAGRLEPEPDVDVESLSEAFDPEADLTDEDRAALAENAKQSHEAVAI